MKKLDKQFIGKNLLVCGITPKEKYHTSILFKDLTKAGIDLFFMSPTPKTDIGLKTYDSFTDLPQVPDCAYIVSDKDKTTAILKEVIALGIKKILFFGPVCYSHEHEELCREMKIETRYGCPIIFSGVLPCRIHAFFGGFR